MFKRLPVLGMIATAFMVLAPTEARAQGFISPFIGYDYGGNSGCLSLTGCEEKKLNFGVALGKLGKSGGFEEEFAYARNFFRSTDGQKSSVLTIMSNLLFAPKIGPVRPYGLFGVGLMKSHVDLTPGTFFSFTNNNFAWDAGAGVMVTFGRHLGLRGDLRHFASFQDIKVLSFLSDEKLDFGRASAGLVLMY